MERGTRRDLMTCVARVFQSDLKTSGDVTRMVYVASLRRLHRCQVKDERVGDVLHWTLLPYLCYFYCIMSYEHFSFFSLLLDPINRTIERGSTVSLLLLLLCIS
jgi:hypothetical protein